MGRPRQGALSSYPAALVKQLRQLREQYPGWGAQTLLVELNQEYGYSCSELPSLASVNRYLREQDLMPKREPGSQLPKSKRCDDRARRPHDVWQLDAQGPVLVDGVGYIAMINIKDVKSKVHCMAFPAPVANVYSQPSQEYYYWALRLAFELRGLPKVLQVDKDSVFRDNSSKSPFPRRPHLWLLGLGVDLCFIRKPPPEENSMVERAHQTMHRQVLMGQSFDCWKRLFQFCFKRLDRINHHLPNRMLKKQAPLQAFPKAAHSGRAYEVAQEKDLIDLKRVHRYLAQGKWFRLVSKDKTLSIGNQVYYLKEAVRNTQAQVQFCNRAKKLIFRDANELVVAKAPVKDLSVEYLMGHSPKKLASTYCKIHHRRKCPI